MNRTVNRLSFYALVIFFFSLPWQDIVKLPGSNIFSVSRLVGLVLVIAGLGVTLQRGTLRLRVPAVTTVLTVMFALWAVCGSLWSSGGRSSTTVLALTYVQLAVMALLIWQLCRTLQDHRTLLQAYVLGAYIVAGQIAVQYLTHPFAPNSTQSMERYTGLGGNPNNTAAAVALALPIAWYLGHFWARGLLRWLNYLYLPLAIFAIILTASRGGFLVALVGLMVVPLTFRQLPPRARVTTFVFALLSVGIIVTVVPLANFSRIAQTSSEISDGNVSNRGVIWKAGLQLYTESPVIGIGTGSFLSAVGPVLGYRIPAHNAFLLVLVEMGIIGFLLFTVNFLVVLWPLLRLRGPEKLLYLCLWLALVVSMLPSNVEDSQYVWGFLTLMATRQAYTLRLSGLNSRMDADNQEPTTVKRPVHSL